MTMAKSSGAAFAMSAINEVVTPIPLPKLMAGQSTFWQTTKYEKISSEYKCKVATVIFKYELNQVK